MKNKEKYQKEILEAFIYSNPCYFKRIYIIHGDCTDIDCRDCYEATKKWLEEEE